LYYLWKSNFVNEPRTGTALPAAINLKTTGTLDRKTAAERNSAACGYQYRMYFAYNFPDVKTTDIKKRQSPESIGYIKPQQHRISHLGGHFPLAVNAQITNHQNLKKFNVLFNDSSVVKRADTNSTVAKLDNRGIRPALPHSARQRLPDNRHSLAQLGTSSTPATGNKLQYPAC
jgi:hypothetical protein